MKIVAVLGSPHQNGPSNTIAREVLRGAADDAYDWFLGDFQNRDMVLHAKIVHTGKDDFGSDSEIMKRAYEAGRTL